MQKAISGICVVCCVALMAFAHADAKSAKRGAQQVLDGPLAVGSRKIADGQRICWIGARNFFWNTIVGVTEQGIANGIQSGDKIVRLNGDAVTRDNMSGIFNAYKPGDKIDLSIRRSGYNNPVELSVECGDGTERLATVIKAYQATARGRWQECIDLTYAIDRINGGPTQTSAFQRYDCSEARRCGRRCGAVTYQHARFIYDSRSLVIAAASYAQALNEIRSDVMGVVSWLENENFGRLARDLESQLRAASQPAPAAVSPGPQKQAAYGTCFAVSQNQVLTSHHVVENAEVVTVQFDNGGEIGAIVAQQSQATDLALLQINGRTPATLPLAPIRSLEVGDSIFTLGFPATAILGENAKFTEGSVSSLTGVRGDASYFQMSIPIQPGNSGGPVVNMNGEVVGVVAATAAVEAFYSATGALPQNVNWASKADYARLLFDAPPNDGKTPVMANREQAIRRTRAALCRVRAK